jgi:hypothetical protein
MARDLSVDDFSNTASFLLTPGTGVCFMGVPGVMRIPDDCSSVSKAALSSA